jgi:hypothetical protein
MPSRVIRSHRESKILLDALSSVLAMEGLKPSKEIYIISPWMSNSPIIENNYDKFSDIFPFIGGNRIHLADILCSYAFKGSNVRLICNPNNKSTEEFINEIKRIPEGEKIEFRILKDNHEKGMVTSNFYLHGSMNFTYSGIHINGENIRIVTEQPQINSALLSVKARWEESEKV